MTFQPSFPSSLKLSKEINYSNAPQFRRSRIINYSSPLSCFQIFTWSHISTVFTAQMFIIWRLSNQINPLYKFCFFLKKKKKINFFSVFFWVFCLLPFSNIVWYSFSYMKVGSIQFILPDAFERIIWNALKLAICVDFGKGKIKIIFFDMVL